MKFDANELDLMFGDDPEIFEEIFADFKDTYGEMLTGIESAIQSKNSGDLEITAHTLKGVLATFCSVSAKEIAYELENSGKNSNFEGCEEKFTLLKSEVGALVSDLSNHSFSKAA